MRTEQWSRPRAQWYNEMEASVASEQAFDERLLEQEHIGKTGSVICKLAATEIRKLRSEVNRLKSINPDHANLAAAAMKLLSPPYRRGGLTLPRGEGECNDWDALRDALMDLGYSWEEYT